MFDGRAQTYDQSKMHRALAESVASFVDLEDVRDVLDVATGTGLLLRALPPGGLRLSGTDISQRMLDEAAAPSFAEWRRLIRPEGRIALTAWDENGIPSTAILRAAALEHGIALEDPNAATGSLAALEAIARGADLRILRSTRWSEAAPAPTAAGLMNQAAPFGPTALDDASSEVRRAVERTLRELIGVARRFEQHSLVVELAAT